jgi:hypothetical protein
MLLPGDSADVPPTVVTYIMVVTAVAPVDNVHSISVALLIVIVPVQTLTVIIPFDIKFVPAIVNSGPPVIGQSGTGATP